MSAKVNLPRPTGPLAVGVTDFELVDTSREELFALGTSRRIPVRVWYPTNDSTGPVRPNVKPAEQEHQVSPFFQLFTADPELATILDVPTHAREFAKPLAEGFFPPLIFSHGGFACPQTHTALLEDLASHGYVIFSISHPYVDSGVIYQDGSVVPFSMDVMNDMMAMFTQPEHVAAFTANDPGERLEAQLLNCDGNMMAEQYRVWQDDFLHVVERLHNGDLPESAGGLLDAVDLERLGVIGMSFGGAAAAAAQRDDRIKAAINIDGGVWDASMIDCDTRVPVLILHSDVATMPGDHPHSEFVFERLETAGTNPDVIRVEIKGTAHVGLTDLCLIPPECRMDPAVAARLGTLNGDRVLTILSDFCRTFFDRHLSDKGSGLDEAFRRQYAEVYEVDLSYIRDWAASNPAHLSLMRQHVQDGRAS